jgi:hypothetical protein
MGATLWITGFLKCLICPNLAEIILRLPVRYRGTNAILPSQPSNPKSIAPSFPALSKLRFYYETSWEAVHLLNQFSHSSIEHLEILLQDYTNFTVTSNFASLLGRAFSHFRPGALTLAIPSNQPDIVASVFGGMDLTSLETLRLEFLGRRTSHVSTMRRLLNHEYRGPILRVLHLLGFTITPVVRFLTKLRAPQCEVMSITVYNSDIAPEVSLFSIATNPISSLHTLKFILPLDAVQLKPSINFISTLTPNIYTLHYTLSTPFSWRDQTICVSHCFFILDPMDDKPPFPLITRLQGRFNVKERSHDLAPLRESIMELLKYRSKSGAVPLELETFSVEPGVKGSRWSIQFTAIKSKLIRTDSSQITVSEI